LTIEWKHFTRPNIKGGIYAQAIQVLTNGDVSHGNGAGTVSGSNVGLPRAESVKGLFLEGNLENPLSEHLVGLEF